MRRETPSVERARRRQLVPRAVGRALFLAARPVRLLLRMLDRIVAVVDQAPAARYRGALRLRRGVAALVFVYSGVLFVQMAVHERMISATATLMAVLAYAVYTNRGGRFIRDWVPVFLGFLAYGSASRAVPELGVPIHYTPQIEAERALAFGSLPTNWLQSHLYDGTTGPLEVFSVLMYTSHFVAPLMLASVIWAVWGKRGFSDLLFGLLAVSLLGEITFMLAPTAPPWLAGEEGLIPTVHHITKQGLYDLGLDELAAKKDLPGSYNLVAALPSLHVAWPVVGLLVIRKHGLPRWAFMLLAFQLTGVVFAIVYTGEHYFVDALAGAAYALAAWWLVQRALGPAPERRPAEAALAGSEASVPSLPAPQPSRAEVAKITSRN